MSDETCGQKMYTGEWATIKLVRCGKEAKWLVKGEPRCGLHARKDNWEVKVHGRTSMEGLDE